VTELGSTSCRVEWEVANLSKKIFEHESNIDTDILEYCLQIQPAKKDMEYREVYKGPETCFFLANLDPNTEYNIRVCAIRVQSSSNEATKRICSSFTSPLNFYTLKSKKWINQKKGLLFFFF